MLKNGDSSPSVNGLLKARNNGKTTRSRILFIDAYDSFSQNIIALLEDLLDVDVDLIHIDDKLYNSSKTQFLRLLASYDAVVAGPGPGNPNNARDIGLIRDLWDLEGKNLLPVLGICLGFQSLAIACGATIERLQEPRHGIVANVVHSGQSIFRKLVNVEAVQYHSLQACMAKEKFGLEDSGQPDLPQISYGPRSTLQPLAWDMDNERNGPVLAAMKHTEKPFWGVQYHPESICTNNNGSKVILNWWKEACSWLSTHRERKALNGLRTTAGYLKNNNTGYPRHFTPPHSQSEPAISEELKTLFKIQTQEVYYNSFQTASLTIPEICTALKCLQSQLVILESATNSSGSPLNSETGQKSIIGLLTAESLKLHYYLEERKLVIKTVAGVTIYRQTVYDIWKFLTNLVGLSKIESGPISSPFWGGLIGYVSYEAGLDTIGVSPSTSSHGRNRPDVSFAWVTQSIVIDHTDKRVYIQSIGPTASEWVNAISRKFNDAGNLSETTEPHQNYSDQNSSEIAISYLAKAERSTPSSNTYCAKVQKCKDYICAGDSYELCLTDRSEIKIPRISVERLPWLMYLRLRKINPAPFQAFLDLGDFQLLGSSPERFLRWNRKGVCQYRPIKGTVKKRPDLTREQAVQILSSSKERAENLMIVDLIRHDLHGVVGSGNIRVQKLMSVEEYASVYQLVSVVEGQLQAGQQGIDVLAASLPPGSMTGAPKRRSCELLKGIEEQKPRGIYSGVLGYLDVGGGGDFSVVIRTAYKWNDEPTVKGQSDSHENAKDVWNIGAGGAVTAQSVDVSEFEEMEAKLDSILRIFDPSIDI